VQPADVSADTASHMLNTLDLLGFQHELQRLVFHHQARSRLLQGPPRAARPREQHEQRCPPARTLFADAQLALPTPAYVSVVCVRVTRTL